MATDTHVIKDMEKLVKLHIAERPLIQRLSRHIARQKVISRKK